jgi:hypothetical protein
MEKITLGSAAPGASQETEYKPGKHESRKEPVDEQEHQQDANEDADLIHAKAEEFGRKVNGRRKVMEVGSKSRKIASGDQESGPYQ